MVEVAAGHQRRGGDHGRAHLVPQVVAQQAAGLQRAGVRSERDQAVVDAGFEPLGQRRLARGRVLQPEFGRGLRVLQARREHAQAAVEPGAARGVARVVARVGLELGGQRLHHFQQRAGAAVQLRHGFQPLGRQRAAFEPIDHRWRLVTPLGRGRLSKPAARRPPEPFGGLG
ncbi:hypothetical protein FQZ97_1029460 [compost metagenome]